ncbi:hypothetical protein [Staphylothermus hellenicus]|uniref:Uncharacterized protein n=1 Tax=Staphylothermus hellenicus (strain DSM 12710 / JCM 10830 / BK20S6-10-b1 / P8) TaxID=591019 RepID=D7DAR0_STAHD|nr:hypothetical protein [Staphylothermus hellenicus]ADI31257.1 hypothetical protein Shell_0110 [Staphylothermus hellenicus DSM 12710]
MTKSDEASIKEEFKKLIKAIYTLLPSRNKVSQLIMLLPLKEEVIQDLYPELFEDIEYWEMFNSALGLYRSSEGKIHASGLADALKDFINRIFQILRDEKYRAAISALLGEISPNPEREWLEVRIKAVLKDPSIGSAAKKVLMLLVETRSASTKELPSKLNIDEQELQHTIYALKNLKLVEINGETISLPYDIRERYTLYVKKLLEESR